MENESSLLPCPFCGGDAEMITRGNDYTKKRSAEVVCKPCHMITIVAAIYKDLEWCKEQVSARWNKRTTPSLKL